MGGRQRLVACQTDYYWASWRAVDGLLTHPAINQLQQLQSCPSLIRAASASVTFTVHLQQQPKTPPHTYNSDDNSNNYVSRETLLTIGATFQHRHQHAVICCL